MATTISGKDLRARREWLGLSRQQLSSAAGIPVSAIGDVECGYTMTAARIASLTAALTAALDRVEAAAQRQEAFPTVQTPADQRSRPWPDSAVGALWGFASEGAAAGADIVAVAGAAPVVVLVGASALGRTVVAWSMGLGAPVDAGLVYRVDVTAGGVDAALDAFAGDGQLARATRGAGVPPLRVRRVVEPAIIAHRDGNGRVVLHVREAPAAVPAPAVLEPAPAPKRRRRVAEPAAA